MGLELLLPVLFFLITLIIIYLLRREDRRDRRLDLIKKRIGEFNAEIERTIQNFRDTAQVSEERINSYAENAKALGATLAGQLSDLQHRSADLSKLQEVLNTYRDSITRLGSTTASVESRIGQVKREIERLETVNVTIQRFDERLEQQMQQLESSLDGQQAHYGAFVAKLEGRYEELERTCQTLVESTEVRLGASGQLLQQMIDRFNDQRVASDEALAAAQQRMDEMVEAAGEHLTSLCVEADRQCSARLEDFAGCCDREISSIVERSIEQTDEAFKTMVGVITSFIQDLEDRSSQSEELHELLIRQQKANLAEYSEEIQLLQQLSVQSEESIRRDELRRRELLEVRTHLREETVALRSELDRMAEEQQQLFAANSQAKAEQEKLQSSLAHLSLQIIERQDELIRGDSDQELDSDTVYVDEDEVLALEEAVSEAQPIDDEEDELTVETPGDDADEALLTEEELLEETAPEVFAIDDEEDELPIEAPGDDADEVLSIEKEGDEARLDDDESLEATVPEVFALDDEEDELLPEVAQADENGEGEQPIEEEADELLLEELLPPQVLDQKAEDLEGEQKRQMWVEYVPEGDEEEISLDEEDL